MPFSLSFFCFFLLLPTRMSGRSFDLNSAVGGSRVARPVSSSVAVRDLASQTVLKVRQAGQGNAEEMKNRDLKGELELREQEARDKKLLGSNANSTAAPAMPALGARPPMRRLVDASIAQLDADDETLTNQGAGSRSKARQPRSRYDDDADDDEAHAERRDRSDDEDDHYDGHARDSRREAEEDNDDDDDDNGDDDDDDDDDDDTEALMRELEKIKRERAEEQARKELERRQEEERIRNQAPSQSSNDFNVKRGWDDDVVFKNCAKDAPTHEKRFINDSLRSDFHRKFMDRYIK
ncbi:hypothetical protein CAOG_006960 [Capsaspora owczarzaki ATCC 30864]|uniref:Uncharacterized protein n=1 Tax=Capsaspora owczarzaki (strain ATCC 30864) TaxID=595528 RepID=A0A0D2WW66_CAPO3|nr:hypothetical protein CAOG_006960 [Capsaspora owczarzaki ATCC 30864]